LQALVAASVFFVWVVRYPNIVAEFQQWRLPDWLRDSVGIVKLTLALMLLIGIDRRQFAIGGGIGLSLLMLAAFATHLRVKNPIVKMLPSLTLLALSMLIVLINYRLQTG
jgi:uncharacterized membrane protein YphA (DoxX/SURF4 family)